MLIIWEAQTRYSRFEKLPLGSLSKSLAKRLKKHESSSANSVRCKVSTNRAEGFAGQLKVGSRGRAGGKLPSRGDKTRTALATAFWRRSPGVEGLGEAFEVFYSLYLDTMKPGTELESVSAELKAQAAPQ